MSNTKDKNTRTTIATLKYEFDTAEGYQEWEKEVEVTIDDYMDFTDKSMEEAEADFEDNELDEKYLDNLRDWYEDDAKDECIGEYGKSKADIESELEDFRYDAMRDRELELELEAREKENGD